MQARVKATRRGEARLELVSDGFMPGLSISADPVFGYSDNYLFLLPGEKQRVTISGDGPIPGGTVFSLKALNHEGQTRLE